MWLNENVVDDTHRSPGASLRLRRQNTDRIIWHRIRYGAKGDPSTWLDQIVDFFTKDPEGIAVTQISGPYSEKRDDIRHMRENGVPQEMLERAFVAYHAIVTPDGVPHQTLPWHATGAHEPPNSVSIGVAFVGDFRVPTEVESWEKDAGGDTLTDEQLRTARMLTRDLLVLFPGSRVLMHDENRALRNLKPKGCPGALAAHDLELARGWAVGAAQKMREGSSRR